MPSYKTVKYLSFASIITCQITSTNAAELEQNNIPSNSLVISSSSDITQHSKNIEVISVVGNHIAGAYFVNASDIQRKQANDLEDLLRDQPNITVGGSLGAAQKIYIRGIEDTNLNISIDGANQVGQLFQHQGRISLEPDILKQIDVKAGAGTALNGFGALGGAIRFETKTIDDLLSPAQKFGAKVKLGHFSNTQGHKLNTNLYGRLNDSWSAMAILGKNDTQEIKDGHGNRLPNTKSKHELGLLKITGQLTKSQTLTISHDHRIDDGIRNLRPQFYNAPWNPSVKQKNRRKTTTLNYWINTYSDLLDLKLTAYTTENTFSYHHTDESNSARIKSYGFDIRNNSLAGEHDLVYGIEYRDDEAYQITTNADESGELYGIYFQDIYGLTDELSLSYGMRYDRYKLTSADYQHFSANGFSPNINAQLALNEYWSIKAGYSQALRGPQTKQALTVGDVNYAKGLQKEQANNKELTIEYNALDIQAKATLFESNIDDVVSISGPPGPGTIQKFENIGNLQTRGGSFLVSKLWQDAQVTATYSHTRPELNGQPLDDAHFGIGTSFGDSFVIHVQYFINQYNLALGWTGNLVKKLTDVPQGYPAKKGYNTHDLYLEWQPLASDAFTVNVTASNLFDKFYFDHGTYGFDPDSNAYIGLPEPGRDIRLTLTWAM